MDKHRRNKIKELKDKIINLNKLLSKNNLEHLNKEKINIIKSKLKFVELNYKNKLIQNEKENMLKQSENLHLEPKMDLTQTIKTVQSSNKEKEVNVKNESCAFAMENDNK